MTIGSGGTASTIATSVMTGALTLQTVAHATGVLAADPKTKWVIAHTSLTLSSSTGKIKRFKR
jgi:hypothetical protein